jgi:tripeptidyl-peptidase-1
VSDDTQLSIVLALRQRNTEELERKFWAVSNPDSDDYQNYISAIDVANLIAPPTTHVKQVLAWLQSNGIKDTHVALTGDLIRIRCSAQLAESLFSVSLHRFRHASTGRTVIRSAVPYKIPAQVSHAIELVGGLTGFTNHKIRPFSAPAEMRALQDSITPSTVRQVFNIPADVTGKAPGNLQATASFLEEYYSPHDLAGFQSSFGLKNEPVAKVIGPNDESNPGFEAQLDIEYIMGLGGVPTWFISTAGRHENQEPFLEWATAMNSLTQLPYVHSVSYGDEESSIDPAWARRIDVEFQKLAVRGASVMFASGDSGVGCNNACNRFVPIWPASSPYITAVGGMYKDGSRLVADSISSGGFSNYYSQPAYQRNLVSKYLSSNSNSLPASSFYNTTGRAMPDVAAFSENVIIVIGGSEMPIAGTSCAAPTFAGIVSLLNDNLLLRGRKTLGFLNPLIYKIAETTPSAFVDVTTGSNSYGCCQGFNAAKGWDPITGNGGINFQNFVNAIQML